MSLQTMCISQPIKDVQSTHLIRLNLAHFARTHFFYVLKDEKKHRVFFSLVPQYSEVKMLNFAISF